MPPKKPERIPSKKVLTSPPETRAVPSTTKFTAPAEPAPQAPVEQAPKPPTQTSPNRPTPPPKNTPKATPPPVQPRQPPQQPQQPAQPAQPPAATTPANNSSAPPENYPDKKVVLAKLKQLDELMEELELDFTEVMVSENWDPIRNIVKQLSKSFS